MSIYIQRGSGQLLIGFDYSEERVRKVRKIPGRKWNPELKKWIIPDNPESIKFLKQEFADEVIFIQNDDKVIEVFTETRFISNLLVAVEKELSLAGYSS